MCVICDNMRSLEDASFRMNVCRETNMPVALFAPEIILIEKYANKIMLNPKYTRAYLIQYLEAEAYDFYQNKLKEYKEMDKIYYCEDYFLGDLENFFKDNIGRFKFIFS